MNNWTTPGYEHLELSTQCLIKAALDRNIDVEILDAKNQWVRLKKGSKTEIIRQSNETSADSYITGLILGDKFIQKKLLTEANINVPIGQKYSNRDEAIADFDRYKSGQFVVKPTTTNYGIGITIMPENVTKQDFEEAIDLAFKHDDSLIIETFAPGIECRFLVIDGTCRAVLHRVPANVIGDGKNSIEALVDIKNQDPKRGQNYKTPLEKIQLGLVENQVLAEKGFDANAIPAAGEQVWLRKNSNISTGGDSLDYTDVVHESYKAVAEKACQSVGAKICGVDIILANHEAAADESNHFIIELNYNPVLYFHEFPYQGENRNVAPYVLDLLGF